MVVVGGPVDLILRTQKLFPFQPTDPSDSCSFPVVAAMAPGHAYEALEATMTST